MTCSLQIKNHAHKFNVISVLSVCVSSDMSCVHISSYVSYVYLRSVGSCVYVKREMCMYVCQLRYVVMYVSSNISYMSVALRRRCTSAALCPCSTSVAICDASVSNYMSYVLVSSKKSSISVTNDVLCLFQ
jgi:hypothetical protein